MVIVACRRCHAEHLLEAARAGVSEDTKARARKVTALRASRGSPAPSDQSHARRRRKRRQCYAGKCLSFL